MKIWRQRCWWRYPSDSCNEKKSNEAINYYLTYSSAFSVSHNFTQKLSIKLEFLKAVFRELDRTILLVVSEQLEIEYRKKSVPSTRLAFLAYQDTSERYRNELKFPKQTFTYSELSIDTLLDKLKSTFFEKQDFEHRGKAQIIELFDKFGPTKFRSMNQ